MININSFGVIGGDRRQAALAESIANDGYSVYAWGFDRLPLEETCLLYTSGEPLGADFKRGRMT